MTFSLNQKISNLVRYRIQYVREFKKDPSVRHCLTEASPALLELSKLVIGWVLSSASWDLLKIAVQKIKSKYSRHKTASDFRAEVVSEKTLKSLVKDIRASLEPIEHLSLQTRAVVKEEAMANSVGKLIAELLSSQNKYSESKIKKEITKAIRLAAKDIQQKTTVTFTIKEKVILKRGFLKVVKSKKLT